MKKLAMLLLAVMAVMLPADLASARGGRGGGRGGARGAGRGVGKSGRRRGNKDKKSRQRMIERSLAENRDAIKRDARVDSV